MRKASFDRMNHTSFHFSSHLGRRVGRLALRYLLPFFTYLAACHDPVPPRPSDGAVDAGQRVSRDASSSWPSSSTAPPSRPGPSVDAGPTTVGAVLTRCRTSFDEATLVDEPPGKLRAIELTCHGAPPTKLRLTIAYDARLFSESRRWPRSLVEPLEVIQIANVEGR